MNRTTIAFAIICLGVLHGGAAFADAELVPRSITVVVTSGMGGWLDGVREASDKSPAVERGGAARLAHLLRTLRRTGGPVVYVDSGSLTGESGGDRRPERALRVLKALECSAIAVGEEDIASRETTRDSPVPLLTGGPHPAPNVSGFRVLRSTRLAAGGVPIAIIGAGSLAADASPSTIRAAAAGIVGEAARIRKTFAADGAGLIIVVVHAAGRCDRLVRINELSRFRAEFCDATSPLLAFTHALGTVAAAARDGTVDLVVGGHGAGRGVSAVVDGIPVVAATADGATFAEVALKVPGDRAAHSNFPMAFTVVPPHPLCGRIVDGAGPCGRRDQEDPWPIDADPSIARLLDQTR